MNRLMVGFIAGVLALSAHSETAVNSDSSRSVGSESSSSIDRQKEITLDKSKREITGLEKSKLRSMGLSKQQYSAFAISTEVPLDSILIPIIRDYEAEVANTDWSDPNNKKSNLSNIVGFCMRYSSMPVVPTSYPFTRPTRIEKVNGQGFIPMGTNYSFVKDAGLAYENPTFSGGSWAFASDLVKRPVLTPMLPLACVYLYATIGEMVTSSLSRLNVGTVKNSMMEETMFIDGDLTEAVKSSFDKVKLALYWGEGVVNAYQKAKQEIEKGCRLPTLYGVQNGLVDWQCGGVTVDNNALTATLGGVPLIGNNYYFGKSVSIKSVDGFELAKAMSVTESEAESVASESESSKGTTLRKGQSTSTKVGAGVNSGSGSGVGSSGQ